ncbi:MAG: transglutaminase-like domain-containing protein [Candidatus Merdivicinus sp.]|jgi:hypothetical protein
MKIVAILLATMMLLVSCGSETQTIEESTADVTVSEVQEEMAPEYIVDEETPLAMPGADGSYAGTINIVENQAPGTVLYQKGGSAIDASNASKGYVMVKQSGISSKLKVQIVKDDKKYNYDLNNAGNYEAFPLQMGDGTYKIRIMQNKEGNKYFEVYSATIDVKLDSANAPFLAPSQYVNYNANSAVVRKSFDLCSGATSELDKLGIIYTWVIENITYDKQKAATVQTGYLPNPDAILKAKTGICFDYAAVMAAMLRAQGIPTKLVVGTVSAADLNHAWNEVYLQGKGWVTVRVYFEGSKWERMDPTFAASGNAGIEQYIGDGSNYTTLRIY